MPADRFHLFMRIAARRLHEPPALPPYSVRLFRTMSPETVQLIGFDRSDIARIRIEVPADEDLEEWSAWMRRWMERRERRLLRASMRVV